MINTKEGKYCRSTVHWQNSYYDGIGVKTSYLGCFNPSQGAQELNPDTALILLSSIHNSITLRILLHPMTKSSKQARAELCQAQ